MTWWLQIVDCTPIERADEVDEVLGNGIAGFATTTDWNWEGSTPEYWSAMGDGLMPIESLLPDIQPLLGESERITFARMVMRNVVDRSAVEYFVVTKHLIGNLSGKAMEQRAAHLAHIAEEDLEKAQKSFDGNDPDR